MKDKGSFLSVCMNPTIQKTLCFNQLIHGAVNRTGLYRVDASGKGINVTRILSQLGKKAVHLTQLGTELRSFFLDLCEKDKLNIRWVESGSAVRFCYTVITGVDDTDNRTVTELVEEGEPVAAGTEERLLAEYSKILVSSEVVIISGTKTGGFSDDIVPEMVRLAREQKKLIILDIRGRDLKQSLPFKPDVIKPNLFEFVDTFTAELEHHALNAGKTPPDYKNLGELTGDEPGVKENISSFAMELSKQYGTIIILSRGKSSVWYCNGNTIAEYPVEEKIPVNTIGSGDAFTAGLAAALDDGLSVQEAIVRGIHCGSLNASFLKPGTVL
ncbi:MAG: PfkB family carbohydrate kinase [Treponema sp.]|jgi:1-phosphofructokinase/tagatose 6-phosphate kinase|nr:PfkB family carbohydrate kinase [Treponema sp.]